ncbi:hypothetical protein SteCoe_29942 [Stentor coeruleus]|uniref:Uncharacterized protein n=1 Tax=Stentor coeruleus TaxID=5963 RepID=A0A1R2B4U3_9CILI|nr:hypothetical protein SteCoe_29942 [Stentor coeruleus]
MLRIAVECFPIHIKLITNQVKILNRKGENAFPILTIYMCENKGYTLLYEKVISIFDRGMKQEMEDIFVGPFVEMHKSFYSEDFEDNSDYGEFFKEISILPMPELKEEMKGEQKNEEKMKDEKNNDIKKSDGFPKKKSTIILPLPVWIFRTFDEISQGCVLPLPFPSLNQILLKKELTPVIGPSSPCTSKSILYLPNSRIHFPSMCQQNLIRMSQSTPIFNHKSSFISSSNSNSFLAPNQDLLGLAPYVPDQLSMQNSLKKESSTDSFINQNKNPPGIFIDHLSIEKYEEYKMICPVKDENKTINLFENTATLSNLNISEHKSFKTNNEKLSLYPVFTNKSPENKKPQQSNKIFCGICKKDKYSDDFNIIECPRNCIICNKCRAHGTTQGCLICKRKYTENDHDNLIAIKNSYND